MRLRAAPGVSVSRSSRLIATRTPLIGCFGRLLLQEVEEGEPALAVALGVGILRRVAAGRVDQHGLLGEPPVAIARAADALDDGLRLAAARERELQAGIDQRRGLAGARRPDDDVPGQVVEVVAALCPSPGAASRAHRASSPQSTTASLLGFAPARRNALLDLLRRPPPADCAEQPSADRDDEDNADQPEAS